MRPFLFTIPIFFLLAACGSGSPPEDSGRLSGPGLYIALGDSLSTGVGASDPDATGFVPRVHRGLGEGWELINLGRSGDTSDDLLSRGLLDAAIALIQQRNGDDDPDNDAKLVTLEIGGQAILDLFDRLVMSVICPSVEELLAKPQCVDSLIETLDRFELNLAIALDRLEEADSDVRIAVMTVYNPISGGIGFLGGQAIAQLVEMALEGLPDTPFPQGLNDTIRSETERRGFILVDWYELFERKTNGYISLDFVHPDDTGYRAMADAILEAVR